MSNDNQADKHCIFGSLIINVESFFKKVEPPKIEFCNFSRTQLIRNADNQVGIYLLKVKNRNTRPRCETFSKLTLKTLERRHP